MQRLSYGAAGAATPTFSATQQGAEAFSAAQPGLGNFNTASSAASAAEVIYKVIELCKQDPGFKDQLQAILNSFK